MRLGSTALVAGALVLGCSREEDPPTSPSATRPARAAPSRGHRHPRLYDRDTSDLVRVLVEKHGVAEPSVMHWAREQLAAMGENALPALQRHFEATYSRADLAPILVNLLDTFGRIASPTAAPLLVGALSHPNEGVRQKAMDALASIGVPEAVPSLATLLWIEPTEANRRSCMRAIAAARTREAAGVLAAILLDPGARKESIEAAQLLASFSEELARPPLEEAFRSETSLARQAAAEGLARHRRPEALAVFDDLARSTDAAERHAALRGFVEAGDARRIAALAADPAPAVRESVAGALGKVFGVGPVLTPRPPPWAPTPLAPPEEAREEALRALRALAADAESVVRRHAEKTLYAMGDSSPAERYLPLLRSEKRAELFEAIAFLCDSLVRDRRATEPLLERLAEPLEPRHRAIVQALGYLGDESAAPAVASLLVRGEGVLFEDGSSLADYAAVHLANLGEIDPVRGIFETETSPAVRRRAVETLRLMNRPDSGALLLERAVDPKEFPEIRIAASRAAPAIAGLAAASPLKRALLAEGNAEIREALNCVLWDYF